jgi:hypothetical protein
VLRTIHKLALPDRFLRATSDDAPETASERKFLTGSASVSGSDGLTVVTDPIAARSSPERRLKG